MELSFEDGKFLAYRLFEVSDEIDLGRAAQQLGVPFTDPRPRMGPLVYALPTLTLALGERELSLRISHRVHRRQPREQRPA